MFVVKATYQGETRKFSLAQSSFPAYDVLQTQVRLIDLGRPRRHAHHTLSYPVFSQ